jgi:hypothetical protein
MLFCEDSAASGSNGGATAHSGAQVEDLQVVSAGRRHA